MANDRYHASGVQAQWQPGSEGLVLRNKQGISNTEEINRAELELLHQLYEYLLKGELPDRRLRVADIKQWHALWLGNLYDWAGQVRMVNMSKGSFQFAAAPQIPRLLDEFERSCLRNYTPCHGLSQSAVAEAIAICHVELILIHPFREGNGRISRLLADVMAVQAGLEPLDYSVWDADREIYFSAIQNGMGRDYEPMYELVSRALTSERT
ncbi:MAG: Fic family protein [Lautropia sp.]|nr:Fic family protein [Lautropia sp.]